MSYVHRTMVVPAALAPTVRQLASSFPSTTGMWTVPLRAVGGTEVTHYISAGPVAADMAVLMEDPAALAAATGIPLAQAEGILGQCIAVDAPWEQVLADNGLEVHVEPEGAP
jgi:hypothetical protein